MMYCSVLVHHIKIQINYIELYDYWEMKNMQMNVLQTTTTNQLYIHH